MTTTGKVKALCVATRCASVDELVATFHRFCDDETFFVATTTMRPVGLETPFAIQLVDRTAVLRGLCVVRETWSSPVNPFGRPGIRLAIVRLTRDSTEVFARLRAYRASTAPVAPVTPVTPAPPPEPAPEPVTDEPTQRTVTADTRLSETRTPGSEYVLPANPLMNLTDASLEGFVDCTLYEDTGAFPLDETTPMPGAQPRVVLPPPLLPPIEPPLASPSAVIGAIDPELGHAPVTMPPAFATTPPFAAPAPTSASPPVVAADATRTPVAATAPAHASAAFAAPVSDAFAGAVPDASPAVQDAATPPPFPPRGATPPPLPVISAGALFDPVDPIAAAPIMEPAAFAAIGSTPPPFASTMPAGSTPPPFAATHPLATPPPTPALRFEPVAPMQPMRTAWWSDPRRWWIAAIPIGIAVVFAIVYVVRSTSADEPAAAPTRPPPIADRAVTPPEPAPPSPPAPPTRVDSGDDVESPPGSAGPPVVGQGPCRIAVAATPAGARVQIDGEAIGPAPLVFAGPCQRRRVELSHARYAATTRWVTPTADRPEALDVTLARPTHALTVITLPPGATVSIDGRRAGTTPTVVQIMGYQSMSVTVEKAGYQTVTTRVYSKAAKDRMMLTMPSSLFPKRR